MEEVEEVEEVGEVGVGVDHSIGMGGREEGGEIERTTRVLSGTMLQGQGIKGEEQQVSSLSLALLWVFRA